MPASAKPQSEALAEGLCHCGRLEAPPHCRRCGSTNLYVNLAAADYEVREVAPGVRKPVMTAEGYRCRRCGLRFSTSVPCKAPPSKALRDVQADLQREAKLDAGLAAHGGDVKAYIKELLEKKKIQP